MTIKTLFAACLVAVVGTAGMASESRFRAVGCEGTYRHHLQGICTNEKDAIYWSFTTALVKTDATGSVLRTVDVANHHGDLCFHDGRIYVAVNLGEFNHPNGNADSWVYVYDADDLSFLEKHETREVFYGAGGMAARDGHFFVVGGLPQAITENYVYEYDGDFRFVKKHVIDSGNTLMGIQTAAFANGCWWFGCYGNPRVLLKTNESFDMIGRYECDASLGIVGLDDGRLLVARGPCTPDKGCTGRVLVAAPHHDRGLMIQTSTVRLHIVYDNYPHDDALETDWGFACFIAGLGKTILFDTGRDGALLLANMRKMQLSPKDVELVVVSHDHGDHTGGLKSLLQQNPGVDVYLPPGTPDRFVQDVRRLADETNVVNHPVKLFEGATLLGPMGEQVTEQALVLETQAGLVIVTGCSHPGIVAIARKAKQELDREIYMIIGGMHLLRHSDEDLRNVIDELKKLGVRKVAPTHCSGDSAIGMFREAFGDGFIQMGAGRVTDIAVEKGDGEHGGE
jgi:metal-dependent hydrolase (beta-lactamase superfamily II)